MTRTFLTVTVAAAAALAGCNQQPEVIEGGPADPMANVTANAGPIELPPAIAASKIYRCKDNSVVYVDWLSDNKSANFRAEKAAPPTQLKAAAEGEAMTAEGYSLTGNAQAASITLTRPGKGSQSCKA
jgi:crotonobetainyl-CoA:carnitine CoA-transferase CaiB-like acyl-CoA transferase